MVATELATSLLAPHGIEGQLTHVCADLWQYRALKGSNGVAVEIQGEPDEAIIREAAGQIIGALA